MHLVNRSFEKLYDNNLVFVNANPFAMSGTQSDIGRNESSFPAIFPKYARGASLRIGKINIFSATAMP
ncbi:MAG TPA: hypothetical protein VEI57_07505 [Nitrospirota bacterium]|nr:hypothetical protein [Nitrospirota bacterium]